MDRVLQDIKEISLKYKSIKKIVLFGSRARKDNHEKSDYDIAIFSSDTSNHADILNDIENIDTLNKIDVVFIKERHKNTELFFNIEKDGVVIMDKLQIKMQNYTKALNRLNESIEEAKENSSLTVRDGVIQRFEFTAELAWKTMREYLLLQEITDINSPKAVMKEAYNNNLISDDVGWLQILQDRNSTSHIYDEEDANEIFSRIVSKHILLFNDLLSKLSK